MAIALFGFTFVFVLSSINAFITFKPLSSSLTIRATRIKPSMAGVPYVPFVLDKATRQYQWMDIYNALGRSRTLFVGRFLDDEFCNQLIASLIWLESQDNKKPITLYFNVPGGNMNPGFAVFDTMCNMKSPLVTINTGLTVGLGALLCAAGTRGQRFAFPNARFLIAKTGLEDGMYGQAQELGIAVREVMKDNEKYIGHISRLTGQLSEKIEGDLKRDFYLTAPEAAMYGIIDKVLLPDQPVKIMHNRGRDNSVVTFGHFAERKAVQAGALSEYVEFISGEQADAQEQAKFDEHMSGEMNRQRTEQPKKGKEDKYVKSRRIPTGRPRPPKKPKDPKDCNFM